MDFQYPSIWCPELWQLSRSVHGYFHLPRLWFALLDLAGSREGPKWIVELGQRFLSDGSRALQHVFLALSRFSISEVEEEKMVEDARSMHRNANVFGFCLAVSQW